MDFSPSAAVGVVNVGSSLQFCPYQPTSLMCFPLMEVDSEFRAPNIPVMVFGFFCACVISNHEGKDRDRFSDLPKTAQWLKRELYPPFHSE